MYYRKCPDCGNKISHKCKYTRNYAERDDRKCGSCASKDRTVFKNGGVYQHWIDKCGKTIADEKMKIANEKRSFSMSGKNNPMYRMGYKLIGSKNGMFGKNHLDSSKEKMKGYRPCMQGKNNHFYGKTHSDDSKELLSEKFYINKFGITKKEYLNSVSCRKKYARKVRQITNKQPLHLLKNSEHRGLDVNSYHLDHIVPIRYGYENNISPEKIGDISNLRFISCKENLIKNDKLTDASNKILESWKL